MNTTEIVVLVIIAAAAGGAVAFLVRRRSLRLRSRFGPEYDRTVEETGSKYRAESKLEKLEKQVDRFSIHPLAPDVANGFRDSWRVIQAGFVDDPQTAIASAHTLVGEVMTARGYPVANFEERVAEISVNHALVVEHYRAAHLIAVRQAQGRASTEDLRQAIIHYRILFEDLIGEPLPLRARVKNAGSAM